MSLSLVMSTLPTLSNVNPHFQALPIMNESSCAKHISRVFLQSYNHISLQRCNRKRAMTNLQ